MSGIIPVREENIRWECDENGIVTIFRENVGFFNRVLQLIMKKPKVSQIHLDEKGSFFWINVDGKNTLADISRLFAEKFGVDTETSERSAAQFLEMLRSCNFARIVNKM